MNELNVEFANILYCINTLAAEGGENALENIMTVSFAVLHDFAGLGIYPDRSTALTLEEYSK